MTKEQIRELIEYLEIDRRRPGMYVRGGSELFTTWLFNFHYALYLVNGPQMEPYMDPAKDREATKRRSEVLEGTKRRGWDRDSTVS